MNHSATRSQVPRTAAPLWTRRRFAKTLAAGTATTALPGLLTGCLNPAGWPEARRRKKVALLATEIRKYSHAQHFVDRILEGYGWEGRHHASPLELAGLYVDQSRQGDLTQDRVRRHGVRLYPSVAEALTLGGSKLAVDGVLIIGEHGQYPRNEMGQTLYPRYSWFKEVVQVFESSRRSVPVFNDKHLSTSWEEAAEMVADAHRLRFALLAGSSLPVTWRLPALEVPYEAPLLESVCACYGGVDSYDFHGFETAQCMSERRAGGESGLRSVLALRGDAVWKAVQQRPQTRTLLLAALARSHSVKAPQGFTYAPVHFDTLPTLCPEPVGFFVEHRDGFQTAVFLLNGFIQDFNYAGLLRSGDVLSTQFHLPMPPRLTTLADFFNPLMHHIEQCILTRKAPYPPERTLLTTGMTAAGVESLHRQSRIETPTMKAAYQVSEQSFYWRS